VLLSGYPSPLYDRLYSDWRRTTYRVLRRTGNGRNGHQHHATEIVWSNRTLDDGDTRPGGRR